MRSAPTNRVPQPTPEQLAHFAVCCDLRRLASRHGDGSASWCRDENHPEMHRAADVLMAAVEWRPAGRAVRT